MSDERFFLILSKIEWNNVNGINKISDISVDRVKLRRNENKNYAIIPIVAIDIVHIRIFAQSWLIKIND